MFNRYTREGDTHVHIKRQPNDAADAARLHGEIREKAKAEAVDAIIDHYGANNEFLVVSTHREYAPMNDQERVRALFRINGMPYDVNVAVDRVLRDKVELAIAERITAEIMRQLHCRAA